MIADASITELVSFLSAVFFAAIASASARGLSKTGETPLATFRKFYLDLSAALVGVTLLSLGGFGAWTMLGTWHLSSTQMSLFLPIAIGLLLLGLAVARHEWTGRKRRRTIDLIATGVLISLIVVAAFIGTSHASAAERLDVAADGAFSVYCSANQGDGLAAAELIAEFWPRSRPKPESGAKNDRVAVASLLSSEAAQHPTRKMGGTHSHNKSWKSARNQTPSSQFCQALEIYLALRSGVGGFDVP
jgi:hypothetical protein